MMSRVNEFYVLPTASTLAETLGALGRTGKFRSLDESVGKKLVLFRGSSEPSDPALSAHASASYEIAKKSLAATFPPILVTNASVCKAQKASTKRNSLQPSLTPVPEPIAIVGLSCRFPCSNSPDEYWAFLMS